MKATVATAGCVLALSLALFPGRALSSPFRNGSFEPLLGQVINWSHTTEGWVDLRGPAGQLIDGWTIDAPISWHSDVNAFGATAELHFAPDGAPLVR